MKKAIDAYLGDESPFAKRLSGLMSETKTTQAKLADDLKIVRQSIQQYASGASCPGLATVVRIAQYFGVSTDYLLGTSDIKSSSPDDMAISKMLGLSDKAIKRLTKASQNRSSRPASSIIEVVNVLLEEPISTKPYSTRSTLHAISDFLRLEKDKNFFAFSEEHVDEGNQFYPEYIGNDMMASLHLVNIQRALSQLREHSPLPAYKQIPMEEIHKMGEFIRDSKEKVVQNVIANAKAYTKLKELGVKIDEDETNY